MKSRLIGSLAVLLAAAGLTLAQPPEKPTMPGDRNLLFGILALQNDFVTRDQLVDAMNAWALAKDRSLGDILREQGALGAADQALLDGLVSQRIAHIAQHGGDVEKSVQAAPSASSAQAANPARLTSLSREANPGGDVPYGHLANPSDAAPYGELAHDTGGEPGPRLWLDSEFLYWKLKNQPLPIPLATQAPSGTSANPGALGDPNTVVLIGGADVDTNWREGGRFTAGAWFDCKHCFGVEGNYFFLARQIDRLSVGSSGSASSPVVGFVFFDATGQRTPNGQPGEAFQPNSIPGIFSGGTSVTISNTLQGGELNGLCNLVRTCNTQINLLAGARYLDLHERLTIANNQTSVTSSAPTSAAARDDFDARNRFYGGQIGLQGQFNFRRAFISTTAKVAFGDVHENVDVDGVSILSGVGAPTFFPSGIYAQTSNIGNHSRDQFAIVPEVTAKIGINVTNHLTAFAGYDFLFIDRVLRPGDQVDHVINLDQSALFGPGTSTGPARPAVPLNDTNFWAQGATFGLELRW